MTAVRRRRVSLRRLRRPAAALAAVAVLVALAVAAACGGDGGDAPAAEAADPGPVHVHGLGFNPGDSALYIATHTGLYRMEEGSDEAERVGEGRQDTMGFTVVGPDHFLGSGHPDLRDGLPPNLGLIESTDAGRSWQSVSLLGEADFHALRVSGRHVVGYDASGGRLMRSADGGRTWDEARPGVALADVVTHPADPARLVAASERGLIASEDGGETWSDLDRLAVLLAWPRADRLYALAPDGAISLSTDAGGSWSQVGAVPGEPAALTTEGPRRLVVALHEGGFVSSADGGRTWSAGAWS